MASKEVISQTYQDVKREGKNALQTFCCCFGGAAVLALGIGGACILTLNMIDVASSVRDVGKEVQISPAIQALGWAIHHPKETMIMLGIAGFLGGSFIHTLRRDDTPNTPATDTEVN